jgi:hypothetical protein
MMVLGNLFRVNGWYDIYYLLSVFGWLAAGVFFVFLAIVTHGRPTGSKK